MLPSQTTEAIILKAHKYGDSSLILNIYSRDFGLLSVMARGVQKSKGKFSSALFQPLNIVEIVFTENKKSDLKYLKEISLETIYKDIPNSFYKKTILIFINEILYKVLKEENANNELFDYIKQSLLLLDFQNEDFVDIHLFFLAGLTKLLGIAPNFSQNGEWFDLSEGMTLPFQPLHNYFLEKEEKVLFINTFQDFLNEYNPMNINYSQRINLLNALLLYYELHIPGMSNIKSISVLHEIINS